MDWSYVFNVVMLGIVFGVAAMSALCVVMIARLTRRTPRGVAIFLCGLLPVIFGFGTVLASVAPELGLMNAVLIGFEETSLTDLVQMTLFVGSGLLSAFLTARLIGKRARKVAIRNVFHP